MVPEMAASSLISSSMRPTCLVAGSIERSELSRLAIDLPSVQLSAQGLANLELLASGACGAGLSFASEADYRKILDSMRLADGTFFPVPITLELSDLGAIRPGEPVALRSSKNNLLGILDVTEIFPRDLEAEAKAFSGAERRAWARWCITGNLRVVDLPTHLDFPELREPPTRLSGRVVGFATEGPIYRPEEEMLRDAAQGSAILIHVLENPDRAGDMEQYARIRACRAVKRYLDSASTFMTVMPMGPGSGSGRAALLNALILRNSGATAMVPGEAHAALLREHAKDIGIEVVSRGSANHISRAAPREYLEAGRPLPESLARPEVAAILESVYPPRTPQGFVIWFTGMPSAGKSSIADALTVMLNGSGRQLTVLDGDAVRTHLSKGLSFSREDRDINILRIGFVAAEISKHGGAVICAAVSPYAATRNQVRAMLPEGRFIEVFVDTPASVCEQRDVKGFYAKARNGEIRGFTGVDDPYEPPAAPELTLPTARRTPEENAREILRYLADRGFVEVPGAN